MHKRVVVAVSAMLFSLLAVLVGIVSDLHDRDYPQQLGAKASASLDFSDSGLSDEAAFRELGAVSDRWGVGLVRVSPDLSGDQSGQVFVPLGSQGKLPTTVRRFGDAPDAVVKDWAALEHSFASGQYLVTGSTAHLSDLQGWLTGQRVGNRWTVDSMGQNLRLVVGQTSFGAGLLAGVALLASLVLYWLSVKARGRALRVLAGVSTSRIQYEDIAGFVAAMLAAAMVVGVVASAYVGLAHGWVFVPSYVSTLATFNAMVLVATTVFAVVMCVTSWPSARMLAVREPAVTRLRGTSVALKAASFVLVLTAVGPALTAYTDAENVAAQQATWRSLSDQVSLVLPAAIKDESAFQAVKKNLGDVVGDAEARGSVALSYTWTGDGPAGLDFGPDRNLALVNQRWLDLTLNSGDGQRASGLLALSQDQIPGGVKRHLEGSLPLWTRHQLSTTQALSQFRFYRYSGPNEIPLSTASGMVFLDTAIVMVAPAVHDVFNDSFLGSVLSSKNLILTGLGATQALVAKHGLHNKVSVKYVAEEGILAAQYTAYFAWLRSISLASLVVALVISALITAFITAVTKARRDFPLRLSGSHWRKILVGRIAKEWLAGVVLAAPVIAFAGTQAAPLVAGVAVLCLLAAPLMHLAAAQWSFTNVSLRKI